MPNFKLSFPRKRESIVEQPTGGSMDSRFRGNDRQLPESKSFKAHLLGGPKVEDFSIDRQKDVGRSPDI
jgi:hypothetical protein